MFPWNKGKKLPPLSKEHKKKISLTNKGRKMPPFSKEWRRKLSKAMKGKTGEKSPGWKGGLTRNKKHVREVKNRNERARRNRKLGADGFHTAGEWETLKAQYNWTCPSCKRKEPDIRLTEDHVVPLSRGGTDNIENVQPLCGSCNSYKYTKIIKY